MHTNEHTVWKQPILKHFTGFFLLICLYFIHVLENLISTRKEEVVLFGSGQLCLLNCFVCWCASGCSISVCHLFIICTAKLMLLAITARKHLHWEVISFFAALWFYFGPLGKPSSDFSRVTTVASEEIQNPSLMFNAIQVRWFPQLCKAFLSYFNCIFGVLVCV